MPCPSIDPNVLDSSKLFWTRPKCYGYVLKQNTEFCILNHVQNVCSCKKQFGCVHSNLDASKIVLDLLKDKAFLRHRVVQSCTESKLDLPLCPPDIKKACDFIYFLQMK